MTPISERALEMGCVCTTTLMAQTTAMTRENEKEDEIHLM